jgi:hypothetical protein
MHQIAILLSLCLNPQAKPSAGTSGNLSWSQWRGPTRDGYVKKGSPWPKSISKEKLRLLWRKELSKGDPGSMFVRELEAIAC